MVCHLQNPNLYTSDIPYMCEYGPIPFCKAKPLCTKSCCTQSQSQTLINTEIVINSHNFPWWHPKGLKIEIRGNCMIAFDDPVRRCPKQTLFLPRVTSLNVVVKNLNKSSRILKKPCGKHVSCWGNARTKALLFIVIHFLASSLMCMQPHLSANSYDLTHIFVSD